MADIDKTLDDVTERLQSLEDFGEKINRIFLGLEPASDKIFNNIKKSTRGLSDWNNVLKYSLKNMKDMPKGILSVRDLQKEMVKNGKLFQKVQKFINKLVKDDFVEAQKEAFKIFKKSNKEMAEWEKTTKRISDLEKDTLDDFDRQFKLLKRSADVSKKLDFHIGNVADFMEKLGGYIRNPAAAMDSLLKNMGAVPGHIIESAKQSKTLGEALWEAVKPLTSKIAAPFKMMSMFMDLGINSGKELGKTIEKIGESKAELNEPIKLEAIEEPEIPKVPLKANIIEEPNVFEEAELSLKPYLIEEPEVPKDAELPLKANIIEEPEVPKDTELPLKANIIEEPEVPKDIELPLTPKIKQEKLKKEKLKFDPSSPHLDPKVLKLMGSKHLVGGLKDANKAAERGFLSFGKLGKSFSGVGKAGKALTKKIGNLGKSFSGFTKGAVGGLIKKLGPLATGLGAVAGAIAGIAVGVLVIGFAALAASAVVVWKSFKKLWEFQNKIMETTAGLNKTLGATNEGMGQLKNQAVSAGVQMEKLGYSFGEGTKLVTEFAAGLQTVKMDKETLKTGMELQAILGMSGEAAGKLGLQFMKAEGSLKGLNEMMNVGARQAKTWGVPVNMVLKDIAEAPNIMARFGVANRKEFSTSAAKARSFGLSIKEVTAAFGKQMDTFEGTATASAKLNAIFGTNINSMKLMMETDPTKRMEMLRKELVKQGIEWDKLEPFQRNVITSTLQIDEATAALMLSSEKERKKLVAKQKQREKEIKTNERWNRGIVSIKKTVLALGPYIDQLMRSFGKFAAKVLFNIDAGKGMMKTADLIAKSLEFLSDWFEKATVAADESDFTGIIADLPEMLEKANSSFVTIKASIKSVKDVIDSVVDAFDNMMSRLDKLTSLKSVLTGGIAGVFGTSNAEMADKLIEELEGGRPTEERRREIQKMLEENDKLKALFERKTKRGLPHQKEAVAAGLGGQERFREVSQKEAESNLKIKQIEKESLERKLERLKKKKDNESLAKAAKITAELGGVEEAIKKYTNKIEFINKKEGKFKDIEVTEKEKGLLSGISKFVKNDILSGVFGIGYGVNDALITKKGDLIKFDPNDNIFASKTPFSEMLPKPEVDMTVNQKVASEIQTLKSILMTQQTQKSEPPNVQVQVEPKIEVLSFEINGREIAKAQVKIAASGVG